MLPRDRRLLLSIPLALALAGPAAAQTPTVGWIHEGDCDSAPPGGGASAELFALKDDGAEPTDWQAHLFAKGGSGAGMASGDFVDSTYQVLSGNFFVPEAPWHVVAVAVSYADGRLHLDSGDLSAGANFLDGALVQTVGDGALLLPNGADVVLPGDEGEYWTDLGSGPERFPRVSDGAVELAFGAVIDLALVEQDLPGCTYGGAEPLSGASGRFVIGYNVYRLADEGRVPARSELASPENWQDTVLLEDGTELLDSLAIWHDPDARPHSGDEMLLYFDSALRRDGSPREWGTAPDLSGDTAWWYAIQPLLAGSVAGFESVSLANRPPADYRLDRDGDGLFDGVDLDLDGSPDFASPQAEQDLPGLGLTNGGLPLISKPVLATPPAPLVGPTLRIESDGRLRWDGRSGAVHYRVRRGNRPDFPDLNPRLTPVDVVGEPVGTSFDDPEDPGPGELFYYRVSAVDRWGRESFEESEPLPGG